MQLQVELFNQGERKVRWLNTCCEQNTILVPGCKLVLEEDPDYSWTIVRTCLALADNAELPLKAQKGTIFCMLKGTGENDVKAAFPQVFVSNRPHGV